MRTLARTASLALGAAVLLGTSACGGGAGDDGVAGPGASKAPEVIDVRFEGDSVAPNGDRVTVGVGQPVELDVTADVAGEVHVHSTPEQELEYAAGTTTLTLTIDKPGIVEVESHALDKTIVQLEVR